jgi:hypothetical protein
MKVYKDSPSYIVEKMVVSILCIFASAAFGFPVYLEDTAHLSSYFIPVILLCVGLYFLYKIFIRNKVLIVSDQGLVLSYLGPRHSKLIPWSDIDSLEQIFFSTPSHFDGRASVSYIMLKSSRNLNLPKAHLPRSQFVHLVNSTETQKITSDVQALIPLHRFQITDDGSLHRFFEKDKFGTGKIEYWDRMKFYGELTLKEILSYKS